MPILTPDQHLRVFVSSTLEELAPERAAAREAIESLRLLPVLFDVGARPHPPAELYRAYLEQSHIFVAIYWQSYGWVAPGAAVSGLEDEFRRAARKPRLVYVKEPAPERDARLAALLQSIESDAAISYNRFADSHELEELLRSDLVSLMSERFADWEEAARRPAAAIPSPATSFVGRRHQLERIEQLLRDDARLLTLTGPGGSGKTRLAVEAANQVADLFDDGAAFVSLESLETEERVGATIAHALGLRDPGPAPAIGLAARFQGRRSLLVLDNFEQVIGAAPLVSELVERAPGLTVLVTSREVLRVRGEHEVRVPPLPLAQEAVRLFADRAASVCDGFTLDSATTPVVKDICRSLDGVPLAIELAAAHMRLMTPEQLRARLEKPLALAGTRDAPAHQRSLDAMIEWSYKRLAADEQRTFRRLGVFRGTFTPEHVSVVCRGDGERSTYDVLTSLVDKSMVQPVPGRGATRLVLLSMIRDYALARLAEEGELESTVDALAAHYLRIAPLVERGLRTTEQRMWKEQLDLEIDSIRVVVAHLAAQGRSADIVALLRALWLWFWLSGQFEEPLAWAASASAGSHDLTIAERGWLRFAQGVFSMFQFDLAPAAIGLAQAQQLFEEAGDEVGLCMAAVQVGFATAATAGEDAAMAVLADGLRLATELDEPWATAHALIAIARIRVMFRHSAGHGGVFRDALVAAERIGDEFYRLLALINLADYSADAGEIDAARSCADRACDLARDTDARFAAPELLECMARIDAKTGDPIRAIELSATADALRATMRNPLWGPIVRSHADLLERLREEAGDAEFAEAWERGRARSLSYWTRVPASAISSTNSAVASNGAA